ncbi:MAG: hypothetical protein KQJ78_23145 [Deltaproteobacteria bacterium]|nr:hypothetical protein [Deltaproteobacteria bacterium]
MPKIAGYAVGSKFGQERGGNVMLGLRTVGPDGASYNGFRWPLEVGAEVEALDWTPKPVCRGLHFLPWGEGDGGLLDWGDDAKGLVIEPLGEVVDLGGKSKCGRARVIFVGTLREAAQYIYENGGRGRAICGVTATVGYDGTATAGDHGTATAGDYGTATVGYDGTATAGDDGTATAGDYGTATVGYRGTATVGYYGTATAGDHGAATVGYDGTATAGDYGTATAGDYGTATAGGRGTATVGYRGTATVGYYGTATVGYRGTATAGDRGTATAGDYGTATVGCDGTATVGYRGALVIAWGDGSRGRLAVGYIGETTDAGGEVLMAWQPYHLDSLGQFVKEVTAV